jgi:hypothetical protein
MIRKGVRFCKHKKVATMKITMTITTKNGVSETILNYKVVAMKTKLTTTMKKGVARQFLTTR